MSARWLLWSGFLAGAIAWSAPASAAPRPDFATALVTNAPPSANPLPAPADETSDARQPTRDGEAIAAALTRLGYRFERDEDGDFKLVFGLENGRSQIGRTVHVSVTSTLQTSAGRLVFARPESSRG